MASKSPETISGVRTTDMICHNVLEIAQLNGLWTPAEIPEELRSASPYIIYLASRDSEEEPLSTAEIERTEKFCELVIDTARNMFARADYPKHAPYRTVKAAEKGVGNCIAFHETVSGILRVAGLYDSTASEWYSGHARTGLVLGSTLFYLDGYDGTVTNLSFEPGELILEAWLEALDTGDIVRLDVDTDNQPFSKTNFELGGIGKILITEDQALIMSAGSLVLAISARGSRNDQSLSKEAKNILQPFAPEL